MERTATICIAIWLALVLARAEAATDPAQQAPVSPSPANEPLLNDVPLLVYDIRGGSAGQQYIGRPSATIVDALNDLAAGRCADLKAYAGATPLSENDRRFESASHGIQIAIRYDRDATAPPTYSFTLTNLNPRVESQLGTLAVAQAVCEPDSKVITKYYSSTSAWAEIKGTIAVSGGKISTDLVLGPAYHLLLPGSIAISSVKEIKYNKTTNTLEARDTPKTGYVGIGYSTSDVYKTGVVGEAFVSLASKPLDSFGVGVGLHSPHMHLGPVQLEQLGVYCGFIWSRNDTVPSASNTQSRLVGKARLMLAYDLAALVKTLKASGGSTGSGGQTGKGGP